MSEMLVLRQNCRTHPSGTKKIGHSTEQVTIALLFCHKVGYILLSLSDFVLTAASVMLFRN